MLVFRSPNLAMQDVFFVCSSLACCICNCEAWNEFMNPRMGEWAEQS